MNLSRRRAILSILSLGALSVLPNGCGERKPQVPQPRKGIISLGPPALFSNGFTPRNLERIGIFKDGIEFSAISLICTHQECLLYADRDRFRCPCHGAQFSLEGKVITGPAKSDLERYELRLNSRGELELDFSKKVSAEWRLIVPA